MCEKVEHMGLGTNSMFDSQLNNFYAHIRHVLEFVQHCNSTRIAFMAERDVRLQDFKFGIQFVRMKSEARTYLDQCFNGIS